MTLFWGSSYGFPTPLPTGRFKDYIKRHEIVASHFYSAYPDATTTIVLSALELDAKLRDFRKRTKGMDPEAFARRLARIRHRRPGVPVNTDPDRSGQAGALTVLTPIAPGAEPALREYLEGLRAAAEPAGAPAAHALRPLGHRLRLRARRRARARSPDRAVPAVHGELRRAAGHATSTSCATSSPPRPRRSGAAAPAAPQPPAGAPLKAYLRAHHQTTGFFVAAYPDATVGQVRAALAQREDVIAFARAAQGMDPAHLQAAFLQRIGG